jgi:hypothetical protein
MIKRDKKKEKLKAEKRESWKKTLYNDVNTESRKEDTGKKVGHRQRVRAADSQLLERAGAKLTQCLIGCSHFYPRR